MADQPGLAQDGSLLAVAAGENSVQVWDIHSSKHLTTLTQPGAGVTYQKLAFSPDGTALAGGFSSSITRWDIGTGEIAAFEPGCRGDTIFDLEYSPDRSVLAIACGPAGDAVGFLIVWDVANHRPAWLKEEILQVQKVAFSEDGAWLATGGPGGAVMVWEAGGGSEAATLRETGTPIADLLFTPDGKQLVGATEAGVVFLAVER
jgi:WD40 repeat protein